MVHTFRTIEKTRNRLAKVTDNAKGQAHLRELVIILYIDRRIPFLSEKLNLISGNIDLTWSCAIRTYIEQQQQQKKQQQT